MKGSTAFILILISAGLFYTFIMPEYDKVKALRVDSAQYQDVLDNVTQLTEKRDELLLRYNALPKSEVESLKKILPDNVDVVELALNLDAIATKYGVRITSVKALDDKDNVNNTSIAAAATGTYQKKALDIAATGSYSAFRSFERDLEQNLRIMEVRNINFTASDTGPNQYDMQIETYWLK